MSEDFIPQYDPERRDEIVAQEAPYVHVVTGTYYGEDFQVTFQGHRRPVDRDTALIENIEISEFKIFTHILPVKNLTPEIVKSLEGLVSEVDWT